MFSSTPTPVILKDNMFINVGTYNLAITSDVNISNCKMYENGIHVALSFQLLMYNQNENVCACS